MQVVKSSINFHFSKIILYHIEIVVNFFVFGELKDEISCRQQQSSASLHTIERRQSCIS